MPFIIRIHQVLTLCTGPNDLKEAESVTNQALLSDLTVVVMDKKLISEQKIPLALDIFLQGQTPGIS